MIVSFVIFTQKNKKAGLQYMDLLKLYPQFAKMM